MLPAMSNVGFLYEYGQGVPRDYAKAREWFEKASRLRDLQAPRLRSEWLPSTRLGCARKTISRRADWYEKAAAGRRCDRHALDLGFLYENGLVVRGDYAKAREWFEKAVAGGDAAGATAIGWLNEKGWGVAQDFVQAREWYEKAANGGDVLGMRDLGLFLENGRGGAQDYAKAREWFEKQGIPPAAM